MILTDSDALQLKKRLISQLEPICDAEPSVLADYVIALLKHDKEDQELMDLCASQLQDFLRGETAAFLQDLFKFLKIDTQQGNVGSNADSRDDNEINSKGYNDRFRDRKRSRRDNKPYKRGICRDYGEKGYCVRDGCRYEHVDKRSASGKVNDDGYDPEDPGMAIDKTKKVSQGLQGNRRVSGSYRLKKDTLVVEKIPPESCSVEKIQEYFKKFGNILNVSINKNQLKAVIYYENIAGAEAAHSCPDSIFGNRFVKAYFLREYGENGIRSTDILDSQNASNPQGSAPMDVEPVKPPQLVFFEKGRQLMELQRNQEAIIAQQIEASKVLMAQLAVPHISPNEKKVILEQLKVLQGSTQSLVEKASEHTKMLKKSTSGGSEDFERQRLDRELDVLNQMAVASDGASETPVDPELKAKFEDLKAEASALGIPGYTSSPRGRGRGGRFARGGRGSARSLRLDNRSKKLLVTGTSQNFQNALSQHCQTLTGIESITPQSEKSAIISFTSRVEAEAAVVKPIKIEGLEGVQVQWVAGETASNPPSATPISADPSSQSLQNWEEDEDNGDMSWKRR